MFSTFSKIIQTIGLIFFLAVIIVLFFLFRNALTQNKFLVAAHKETVIQNSALKNNIKFVSGKLDSQSHLIAEKEYKITATEMNYFTLQRMFNRQTSDLASSIKNMQGDIKDVRYVLKFEQDGKGNLLTVARDTAIITTGKTKDHRDTVYLEKKKAIDFENKWFSAKIVYRPAPDSSSLDFKYYNSLTAAIYNEPIKKRWIYRPFPFLKVFAKKNTVVRIKDANPYSGLKEVQVVGKK